MEPLTMLIWAGVWAGVAASVYTTVYFADLTAQIILKWFRNFAYLLVENDRRSFENREYVAFTVQQAMASGDYNVVEGIFDNKNQKVYDARVIKTSSIDSKIRQAHDYGRKEVAFWQ